MEPSSADIKRALEHLGSQFERALPILFLGAGFSLGATTLDRTSKIPSAEELKKKLHDEFLIPDTWNPAKASRRPDK
jgi:hypothetical protein